MAKFETKLCSSSSTFSTTTLHKDNVVVDDLRVILKELQQQEVGRNAAVATERSKPQQQHNKNGDQKKKKKHHHVSFDDHRLNCTRIVERIQAPDEVAEYWYSKQEKMVMAYDYLTILQFYRDDDKCDNDGESDSLDRDVAEFRQVLLKLYEKGHTVLRQVDQQVLTRHYLDDDDHIMDGPRGLERLILQQESGKRVKKHLRHVLKAQKRHRQQHRQKQEQCSAEESNNVVEQHFLSLPPHLLLAACPASPIPEPTLVTEQALQEKLRGASLKTSILSQRFSRGLAQYDAAVAA